jgi:hypothetical protein
MIPLGTFNAKKCVQYLRHIGVEVTDEMAAQWNDAEQSHRLLKLMKRPARTGADWWCDKEHQNFVETRRGQRRKNQPALKCRVCDGPMRVWRRRYDIAIDGSVRDYRKPEDRWRALAHPTGVHTPLGDVRDEPLRFVGTSARLPESPDGRVWLPCVNKHCRSWNCFEAVNGDGE